MSTWLIIYLIADDTVESATENEPLCGLSGSCRPKPAYGAFITAEDPAGKTLATDFGDFGGNQIDSITITQAEIDAATTVAALKAVVQKICDKQQLIT